MIIKSLESKMRFSMSVSAMFLIAGVLIMLGAFYYVFQSEKEAQKKIYALDNGIPVLLTQTDLAENRDTEYRSHINMFHLMFFTIPPDDAFIKNNMDKAMYLIDNSGLMEYNNLRERGFYNQILASSSSLSITTDSIQLDKRNMTFKFFGTQRIDRPSMVITREIQTTGKIKDLDTRSDQNPHGVLIYDWRTVLNKDIEAKDKNAFK
ncbi:MAG: conjugative transposon protein TraK [Bacteroidota bacterium]